MLGTVFRSGFSKTARSHPGHREARRHWQRASLRAIGNRRRSDDFMESAAERAEAVEADLEADVGHAAIAFPKQKHCALDTASLEIAVRRLTKCRSEGSRKMGFGNTGDPGEGGNVKGTGIGAVHRVAGAKHPTIRLFQAPVHDFIKSQRTGPTVCWSGV